MSMYGMCCADLDMRLDGDGKVVADQLRTGDSFRLWLGEYTSSFRGAPLQARSILIQPSSGSSRASVRVDALGEDCGVVGGALGRLELLEARLQDELEIADVEVAEEIRLTGSTLGDVNLHDCKAEGIDLEKVSVAGDLHGQSLELGSVSMHGSRIEGEATFRHVTTDRFAVSGEAYVGLLDLAGCTIAEHLEIVDTSLGHLALDRAEIARMSLSSVVVEGHASLRAATLTGRLLIADSTFAGSLTLHGVAAQDVALRGLQVADSLGLFRARVDGNLGLTDVSGVRTIDFRELRVAETADVEVSAGDLDASESTFAGAFRLRAETNVLRLASATFLSRAEIECEGLSDHLCALDLQAVEPRERLLIDGQDRSSVVDLRRGRCDGVRLQAVALDRCLFDGATGLGELRLTGESFARRARGLARGRVVLAEDADFDRDLLLERAQRLVPEADAVLDQRKAASASQMAQRYRSLRKGLEDSKDSAGASEFYFAEMLMRRSDPGTGTFERALLWAYRVFGGYGVRPLAPAVWLAALLLAATVGANALGAVNRSSSPAQHIALARQDCQVLVDRRDMRLRCPATTGSVDMPPAATERDFGHVMLVIASSTFGFTRALDGRLEPTGQAIIIIVRLLGAVLLGLFFLALRSAVRR
jgi:uncharacterized protein YjbI with pentapeptide repeats